jgi:hypothetical protein
VINLLGQVVFAESSALLNGKLQKEIKLHDAADGIYLVKVTINEKMYSGEIFYQK